MKIIIDKKTGDILNILKTNAKISYVNNNIDHFEIDKVKGCVEIVKSNGQSFIEKTKDTPNNIFQDKILYEAFKEHILDKLKNNFEKYISKYFSKYDIIVLFYFIIYGDEKQKNKSFELFSWFLKVYLDYQIRADKIVTSSNINEIYNKYLTDFNFFDQTKPKINIIDILS